MTFTIGKMAKQANVGVETIRYYERRGLIIQPPQPEFGYRQYPETTLHRLRFIKNTQMLGFTLNEIKGFLDLLDGREINCTTAASLIELKIAEIRKKIESLQRLMALLKKLSSSIGTCGNKSEITFLSEFLSEQ